MPLLQRRNLSRLGKGQTTDQGHKGADSRSSPLQMYKLLENLSTLSYRDNAGTAIQQMLDDLPVNGRRVLYELWKAIPVRTTAPDENRTPLEKLRDLVLRLSRNWERYIEFYSDPGWSYPVSVETLGLSDNGVRAWMEGYTLGSKNCF